MISFTTVLKQQPTLKGQYVTLEPASLQHVADLQAVVDDGRTYELFYTGVPYPSEVERYLRSALEKSEIGEQKIYVIRSAQTSQIVGCTRYYDIDGEVPRLAIGYTFYAESVRRSAINTETKLLLLKFAFETAGAEAIVFHTSFQNQQSRTAIERLGARQDGILRADKRHKDGTLRDTVVYSILRHEWMSVRSHLELRLAAHDDAYVRESRT